MNEIERIKNKRMLDITLGDVEYLINAGEFDFLQSQPQQKEYVYGINGIAQLFGCSKSTAIRLKKGILAPAVIQTGRKIIVDVKKAMALFSGKTAE